MTEFSPGRNGDYVSLFTGEISTTLKMSENYSGLKKPMINRLFHHARGCFLLKCRIYQNFQKYTPENTKKLIQLLCWWNQSKSVNIERAKVYFLLGAFMKKSKKKKQPKKQHAHPEINMAHDKIQIKNKFYLFIIVSGSKIFFCYFIKYFRKNWNLKDK